MPKRTNPKDKKRSKPEKSINRKNVSEEILEVLKHKMGKGLTRLKKTHTADVFRANKIKKIEKKSTKDSEINFLRHLSTVILCNGTFNKAEYVEVQAALSIKNKKIYISANNNGSELPKTVSAIEEIRNNIEKDQKKENPKITLSAREKSHLRKLKGEIASYKDYTLSNAEGKAGIHAEMKIIDKESELDALAGVKRPCLACFAQLKLKDIKAKYNPHAGAFWATKNALSPLVDDIYNDVLEELNRKKSENVTTTIENIISKKYDKKIREIKKPYVFYCDKNGKPQIANDSDSEDEYTKKKTPSS